MEKVYELMNAEEAPDTSGTPLERLGVDITGAVGATSAMAVAMVYFGLTLDPFSLTGAAAGSLGKDAAKRLFHKVANAPRVKPYLEIAVQEMESRSRNGFVLAKHHAGTPGGFSEVVEECLRQLFEESEELKRKHLAKMMARSAEDHGVGVDTIKLLLKIAPELTFEDMRLLEAFRRLGDPSGWR